MAKMKNKKKYSADRIQAKKELTNKKKSLNPFEVHINKEKLRVIGKKQKNDRGLPGVSRAKAIEKRKYTILQEYKVKDKSNKFMDKRIGEKNSHMTNEDRIMARFTAVRVKANKKKSIYNLADDEVLTHRGQTLNEIERFDDPRSEDEDDEERGNLDKEFVEDAHFGGGVLKKTGKEGVKSHKDLIDQLISESKKRKAEKQKTKENTMKLTEKLDSEWKDLLPLVSKSNKEEMTVNSKLDDYDKVMRELKFEARGTVSDRIKTENEIAKEEREKLEQLEKERLDRMKGFVEKNINQPTHKSADDLDDNFVYESDSEYVLSYNKEGQSNVKVNAEMNGIAIGEDNKIENDEQISNEESSDDGEEVDAEDNLSDLKDESSDSESDSVNELSKKKDIDNKDEVSDQEIGQDVLTASNSFQNIVEETDIEKRNSKQIKEMLLARNEIPYLISVPDSYENLQKLFRNETKNCQSLIIERLLTCYHPSLAEGNKDNLVLLFAYLLQYINDLFSDISNKETIENSFKIFKSLVPQVYNLAQMNTENTHSSILEVIKEKHIEYRKRKKEYPSFEILIFLKLVSLLFSTSDFRHQIVTPCFVFIEQMLFKCRVKNKKDISYGLFLTTVVLEYTTLSRRYMPATINFLSGLLYMAVPKTEANLKQICTPFKSPSLLVLTENCSLEQFSSLQMISGDLLEGKIEEEYKVRVLYNTINILQEFYSNLQELSSCVEIFELPLKYLQLIPTNNYPKSVISVIENCINVFKKGKDERNLKYVVIEAKKPKSLRLYEPKIEEIYDGKRKFKVQSREKAERNKLLHKLKMEKKGAIREIRRDKDFLGRIKIDQKIKSDFERRDKVKRIYSEAAIQQSELNQLDRKKKRKK